MLAEGNHPLRHGLTRLLAAQAEPGVVGTCHHLDGLLATAEGAYVIRLLKGGATLAGASL